jgi:hypothetical protein
MNSDFIKNRIKKVFEEKKENSNSFSNKCNLTQRTINRQVNEESSVGYDILYAIASVYPDISMQWLITGEGGMLIENVTENPEQAKIIIEMELNNDDLLNLNFKKQIKKII